MLLLIAFSLFLISLASGASSGKQLSDNFIISAAPNKHDSNKLGGGFDDSNTYQSQEMWNPLYWLKPKIAEVPYNPDTDLSTVSNNSDAIGNSAIIKIISSIFSQK